MNRGTVIDNYVDNEKIFRFPYFSTSLEYQKLKLAEENAKIAERIAKDPNTHKIISGRGILPDKTAFNNMFNTVLNINRYQRNIKKKLKYLPLNDIPFDHNNLTIGQLKNSLFVDFFDMCNELLLMEKFSPLTINFILSKNYRKITLLTILLLTFLLSFVVINISSLEMNKSKSI